MTELLIHQPNRNILDNDTTVDIEHIPNGVRSMFQENVEAAGFPSLESAGLSEVSELLYSNGDRAFYGTFTSLADGAVTEESTLLVDVTPTEEVTGIGKILFFKEFKGMPGIVGAPFVSFTRTDEHFRRRGLAERRLRAMNDIAISLYNEPLRSGTHQAKEVVPLWERLVREGVALRLSSGEFAYRFK